MYHPSTQRASSLRNKKKESEVGGLRVLLSWERVYATISLCLERVLRERLKWIMNMYD